MSALLRASIFHTVGNPFHSAGALRSFDDGALVVRDGMVQECGAYSDVRRKFPEAVERDLRGSVIVPGFVDAHTHFPQVRVLGGLGLSLLDWLEQFTLPEEARMADVLYAALLAEEFVRGLVSNGTTTALVFGSHFVDATALLFDAAERAGLRLVSGLVLADRGLRDELHVSPEAAYRGCQELRTRIRGRARLGYAVIPRFAPAAGEAMLEVCGALLREDPSVLFTTHINENPREIEAVRGLFPWAQDYLAVYEKFGLIGPRAVLAHNIHAGEGELNRLAGSGASVAHCPCSNAALGSGIFPLRRHAERNVRVALGTDVGAGTGFGMMKEALQAHLLQRLAADPMVVSPAQMLYLATRAGAEALGMEDAIGDFEPGKRADFVVITPRPGSPLAGVPHGGFNPLAALFTLAGAEDIAEVCVDGERITPAR